MTFAIYLLVGLVVMGLLHLTRKRDSVAAGHEKDLRKGLSAVPPPLAALLVTIAYLLLLAVWPGMLLTRFYYRIWAPK